MERVKRKSQKLKEGLIEGWPQSALRGKLLSVKLTFNFFCQGKRVDPTDSCIYIPLVK